MNEMLIIYLYGIYPEGEISLVMFSVSLLIVGMWFIIWITEKDTVAEKFIQKWKFVFYISAIVWTVGYFIPSKNTFLTMVATPHIIDSLESKTGKLNKIDKLFNKALDKALENINEGLNND